MSKSSPILRRLATRLILVTALAATSRAATVLSEGHTLRIWQTDDGLPQNAVTAAVQTADGYLWIGTFDGLARFDGERFEVFDPSNTPALLDARIVSLFEDAEGTLWIGHESGVVTRYRHGRFETIPLDAGAKRQNIGALFSDADGRLWVLHHDGTLDSPTGASPVPTLIVGYETSVLQWSRSARGDIWVVENGVVAHLNRGKLDVLPLDFPNDTNFGLSVATSARGGVWVASVGKLRRWDGTRWVPQDERNAPWGNDSVSCSLELRDGTLAVGTVSRGLYLLFPNGRPPVHFDQTNGLPQDWIRCLYEDRERNLWLGAGSGGLVAIHASAFSSISPPDQWQGRTVLTVAPGHDGALWVGTEGAALYRHAGDTWQHFGSETGLTNWYIWAIREDKTGTPWVGCWSGGPYRGESGKFVTLGPDATIAVPILAILPDPNSSEVLVGNRDGLFAIGAGAPRWLYRPADGAPANVGALVRDREGVVWFGLAEGALGRLAQGNVTFLRQKDGLAAGEVQCLHVDADDTLWIGTSSGLSRYRAGHFSTIGVDQGLASNVVCHIEDDGMGYLWLTTRRGLQRVARDDLNRCADGAAPTIASRIFDRADGLPTQEFTERIQAGGCRTSDGRLWFPSSKGLIEVDPTKIEHNPTPPPVVIESMLVDGHVRSTGAAPPEALPPDHQRLEFRFAGLSFIAPSKVAFKYRLDGIDHDWVDAGAKRIAYYSRLPAGAYHFRVVACNNDGVWNTTGATLAFAVAPFFWQTWWFVGTAALTILASVALFARYLTRRRMQRRLEHLERQHALERERARIAQDIHDDIGTSLTRIAMFSQPEGAELAEPQETSATLSRIYTTTREATRALDEIVWAIDPRHDTLDGLVGYMGRFAQEMLDAANIRCRLHLPVELPPWPVTAEIRHNLFLAFKEALNNTVKHAGATEVRISLELRTNAFVLILHDDGRGFDRTRPAAPARGRIASGHGLANLERRLARIGGRCEIVSEPGKGTTVSFLVVVPDQPPARSVS